ncbi:Acetyltransferase (Isoleucine patch superfamily)-like protein [Cupriavidus taiwanensis]|uniref:Acetyltransferase (Isoleucine patch superfamily)-like protein n=1 Tax=Cupriavidus taiwanensis TaxID=164546 RepID=A0A7Z7JHR4_9BURK|nr:Acetyltransferase (Isoleucine patch superfamily)-like protein [Cupriavidus taiwanensis]SOZ96453.1 Acetyltransferase (Isoleucine patch superfamily)-like protein [Cupriavidus taiwanensis]SPC25603.1 Acetyltransferase (Isoleucine patch superfamily)-like protein [Cupriavidus taiwanensis]
MSFVLYLALLLRRRISADSACHFFNSAWLSRSHRHRILRRAFPGVHAKSSIARPFHAGTSGNFLLGYRSFMNSGCVVLNGAEVRIGEHVLVGPGVKFCTDTHHVDPCLRHNEPHSFSRPITVGDHAWIGAGAVICPGVVIGQHAVVAAGSVVTRDIPAFSLVAGSPAVQKRTWPSAESFALHTAHPMTHQVPTDATSSMGLRDAA